MEKLIEILEDIQPDADYENCTTLIDDGILESFAILSIVGELEDEFDWDGMMKAQNRHQEHFHLFLEKLCAFNPEFLPLGTGCCMICKTCSYPDAPCRFPQKRISSMEACGMVASEVCRQNRLKYYYGPNTIAYVACVLVKGI